MLINFSSSYLLSIWISGNDLGFVVNQFVDNVVFPGNVIVALDGLEGLHILVHRPLRLLCLQGELWSGTGAVLEEYFEISTIQLIIH